MIIKILNNVNTNFNNLITLEEIKKYVPKNTNSNLIELKQSRLKSYLTKKRPYTKEYSKYAGQLNLKTKNTINLTNLKHIPQ
ncbi:hypothetical protein QIA37_00160 (plasmid) [Borrelia sp. CA_690]|uniref:hypothetical protein n=1 Tax=Borrelia sp. CA_690 TaxID=2419518 RepID=UPI0026494BDF|nr:hypothetical protein [Borrelia sp. CA_690]WKC83946.1 hypothetical protein QIA37_00160 [Borrelia sp. CA_690]